MKFHFSSRACAVLYNTLKANNINGYVLLPSNICESVPATYLLLGIQPIFCDIDLSDLQIDKKAAKELLDSQEVSVLHYNHTYGYISNTDNKFLCEVKNAYPEVFIVDDRCLCFPELNFEESPADLLLYSTGNVKCVDIGHGGYGAMKEYVNYHEFHLNYSQLDLNLFDEHIKECHKNGNAINKKILLSNWLDNSYLDNNYFELINKEMPKIISHKKHINEIYQNLPGSLPLGYCNWRYQLLLENSKECIKLLFDNGLFCSSHYKSLGNGYFSNIYTPNNNWLEKHIINLFNDFRYTEEQAIKTVEILKTHAVPKKEARYL